MTEDSDEKIDQQKAKDQEEKLQVLISFLKDYCNDQSEHEDLRKFGEALRNGASLAGKILSGGYTNYSYKIHLDDSDNDDLAIFAKIAFPYALWSPDSSVPYDLSRVKAEFDLMKRFSDELCNTDTQKSSVPKPYVLIDIPETETSPNMKVFVAEWVAPTDEQWGNQFIEGDVDLRVIDKCAQTLAKINLADVDGSVNQGFLDTFANIAEGFDPVFLATMDREKDDRTVIYARDVLGKEKMKDIIQGFHVCNAKKEALVHGDAHVFNMLVERKPNPYLLESSFGPHGDFFLCDWEMAHKGHKGRDISNFFSFPVMSACFLAARGHKDKADAIVQGLRRFWETYEKILVSGLLEKQHTDIETYEAEVFHSAIAFFGYFSFIAFYCLGCMIEFNETEGLNDEEVHTTMGIVGWIGLRSMEVGFLESSAQQVFGDENCDATTRLAKMESFLFGMIQEEVDQLFESSRSRRRRSRRRSSMLRESSRRVSDSESGFGKMVRRLSQQIAIESVKEE